MSFLKRLFCLMLSFIFLFLLCACSSEDAQESVSDPKPQTITINKQEKNKIGVISLSNEAAATSLANKDFLGADISYYTTKQMTELQKLKLAAFSKAHNCTVKVTVDAVGGTNEIASSIASGTPFDIVENNIETFSRTCFYNIYEPLQSSIDTYDLYSSERPEDSGLANVFSSRFTIKGNLLAVGSAQSSDFYILYYNRSLFKKAEFDDPKEMWETGRWSFNEFSKMASVTSFVSGDALLQTPSLSSWLNIKGIDILKLNGNTFSSALNQEKALSAVTDYYNLIYGTSPICIPKSSKASFERGNVYCIIDKVSNFSYWQEIAKTSNAFERNQDNLGVVVLPTDLSQAGVVSAADIRCYSALKGAKNPTAAACFALYESRSFELEKSQEKLPDQIIDYLVANFNNNGFIPNFNFVSKNSQESIYDIVDSHGMYIRDGKRPDTVITKLSSEIETLTATIPKTLPKPKK